MPEPDARAYEEAERLVRAAEEAARAAAGAVPPRGWQSPGASGPPAFPDLSVLSALTAALRGALPPELARPLADALRELLIAIRAVLDYSIERLERPPPAEPEVEDIPIR